MDERERQQQFRQDVNTFFLDGLRRGAVTNSVLAALALAGHVAFGHMWGFPFLAVMAAFFVVTALLMFLLSLGGRRAGRGRSARR